MRVFYPLSEHVDIFPVRLCLHSHWVHSVYLTLAFYLMWSSSILAGGIKDKGWILFLLSIKIHYIFISDMERSTIVIQLILWLSLLVRLEWWYGVKVILRLDLFSYDIWLLAASLGFAWTALRAVRTLSDVLFTSKEEKSFSPSIPGWTALLLLSHPWG